MKSDSRGQTLSPVPFTTPKIKKHKNLFLGFARKKDRLGWQKIPK
ncbi:hypothetical protein [uncultured Sunxiuqinia sp.]|nr:hypothetical protein [uncultured Sunxiuqinia sp.]